jgi:propionaldehyde dehydrogenase
MNISPEDIKKIVRKVLEQLPAPQPPQIQAEPKLPTPTPDLSDAQTKGIFSTLDQAIAAASRAQKELAAAPLALRDRIIAAMREVAHTQAENLARLAIEDTKRGRFEDKVIKNHLVADKSPGTEDLPQSFVSGDMGACIEEVQPFGVIGSITPVTNPTATVINHCIIMSAGGNGVVFNPHPSATSCTLEAISLMNMAASAAGGPAPLFTAVSKPSLRSAKELMAHPDIDLLVATGGPGVVRAAMNSGKKVVAAGPGNPPVLVDETADIAAAAKFMHDGASFDNNMPCVCEKEFFVARDVAEELLLHLRRLGTYMLTPQEAEQVAELIITKEGNTNSRFVGLDADVILKEARIHAPAGTKLAVAEVDLNHPFVQLEMLMPIIGMVRVADFKQGLEYAKKAEHGFGHTAMIHSRRIDRITQFAQTMKCNITVANGHCGASLGYQSEGCTAFTIAGPTGEGITTPRTYTKRRRLVLKDNLRMI